jgi:hypothetical protein
MEGLKRRFDFSNASFRLRRCSFVKLPAASTNELRILTHPSMCSSGCEDGDQMSVVSTSLLVSMSLSISSTTTEVILSYDDINCLLLSHDKDAHQSHE